MGNFLFGTSYNKQISATYKTEPIEIKDSIVTATPPNTPLNTENNFDKSEDELKKLEEVSEQINTFCKEILEMSKHVEPVAEKLGLSNVEEVVEKVDNVAEKIQQVDNVVETIAPVTENIIDVVENISNEFKESKETNSSDVCLEKPLTQVEQTQVEQTQVEQTQVEQTQVEQTQVEIKQINKKKIKKRKKNNN
jgi:hypothetical protein